MTTTATSTLAMPTTKDDENEIETENASPTKNKKKLRKKLSDKEVALLKRVVLEKYSKRAVLLRALQEYNQWQEQEQRTATAAPSGRVALHGSKYDDDDDDASSITTREDDDDEQEETWSVRMENRIITIYCERRHPQPSTASTPTSSEAIETQKTGESTTTPISPYSDTTTITAGTTANETNTDADETPNEFKIDKDDSVMAPKQDQPPPSLSSKKFLDSANNHSDIARNISIATIPSNNGLPEKISTSGKSTKDRIAFWNKLAHGNKADGEDKGTLDKSITKKKVGLFKDKTAKKKQEESATCKPTIQLNQ